MTDFLLELASEEIPARMQAAAAAQLATRFTDGLKAAGLVHGRVIADATPRRLWLVATGLAAATEASVEERKGPRADAPPQAIDGFLRSTGLTRDQLEERETPKGVVLFANIASKGQPAAAILAALVPQIVTDFAWPKSMRWGAASASTAAPRWVRPLTGIVALLGDDVVPCSAHGLSAGRMTRGHRIHAPQPLEIESPAHYAEQLRVAKVIVSSSERRALIADRAAAAASSRGLTIIPDAALEAENAGLTEWPVPLLGHFDPAFLAVPREVIQLTMRTNQKYFACADADGALAPAFVCVANLEASDGGNAIIKGNERVLSARLSDAKFFWDQDLALVKAGGLDAFLPKLADIVFHEKLGTVADKVERIAVLARSLTESLGPSLADPAQSERAARLCKADLVSATVSEFPEVQGLAGRYLALSIGEKGAVADAIRDHYKPVGQGDDVPTAAVSVAVALADKIDTIVGFFCVANELPSGSRDPFALRRSAIGVSSLIIASGWRLSLTDAVARACAGYTAQGHSVSGADAVVTFLVERLKVQQREAGVRHDLIDAVFATGGENDLVRLLARVDALQAVLATDDGANLLAGVKRASNILRIEEAKDKKRFDGILNLDLAMDPFEQALASALSAELPLIREAVAQEDFVGAMARLAGLRAAVDAFFDNVIVNADDKAIRINRLELLSSLRSAANSVADFSRIEG